MGQGKRSARMKPALEKTPEHLRQHGTGDPKEDLAEQWKTLVPEAAEPVA